jgi:hypothetical protein
MCATMGFLKQPSWLCISLHVSPISVREEYLVVYVLMGSMTYHKSNKREIKALVLVSIPFVTKT